MASKYVFKKQLLTAQSLAADFQSAVSNIENCDKVSWSVIVSSISNNTGTFSAQVRMKDEVNNLTSSWIDIDFSPTPTLADADAQLTCLLTETCWTEARLAFTAAGVTAPVNKTFVDGNVNTSTEKVTITTHGFYSGLDVTLTTTGVLPVGLALLTTYYVIVVDANTIQLATTYANALAATPINISTAAGGGTHTVVVGSALPNGSAEIWVEGARKGS